MRYFYANVERVGGSFRTIDGRTTAVTFMGEVTNWLTTARHVPGERGGSLSWTSRDGAEELQRYHSVCSEVFDSNAGYRFLYNMRDCAQHCGPPLGGLIAAAGDRGRTLELYISRSNLLLANFKWNQHARYFETNNTIQYIIKYINPSFKVPLGALLLKSSCLVTCGFTFLAACR